MRQKFGMLLRTNRPCLTKPFLAREAVGLTGMVFLFGIAMANEAPKKVVADLAPTGRLRVAINFGNTVLAQRDPVGGPPRGVSAELARELGSRLGVPLELPTMERAR